MFWFFLVGVKAPGEFFLLLLLRVGHMWNDNRKRVDGWMEEESLLLVNFVWEERKWKRVFRLLVVVVRSCVVGVSFEFWFLSSYSRCNNEWTEWETEKGHSPTTIMVACDGEPRRRLLVGLSRHAHLQIWSICAPGRPIQKSRSNPTTTTTTTYYAGIYGYLGMGWPTTDTSRERPPWCVRPATREEEEENEVLLLGWVNPKEASAACGKCKIDLQ